jgi:hypothetical protein
MPNNERLTRLRDAVLDAPDNFNMKSWADATGADAPLQITPAMVVGKTPGVTACLGGWASALFFPESNTVYVGKETAGKALGLTKSEADQLFYPCGIFEKCGQSPYRSTNVQAARVLDHLIETGEVDWSKAFPSRRKQFMKALRWLFGQTA